MWFPFKKAISNFIKKEVDKSIPSISFNGDSSADSELNEAYLYDFKAGYRGGFDNNSGWVVSGDTMTVTGVMEGPGRSTSQSKIKIKPVDVLNELETIVTPFSLNNLDDKIEILNDKKELLRQVYAKREVSALIERLENRKVYTEHRKFFDNYQNTDQVRIDKLLEKYDLVMKESEIFIPQFPDEAIKTMKKYTNKIKKITGKKPVFYVIAENSDFQAKDERLDPILLVQSPFGFYYQILGAWDKEMLLLSEL